MVTCAMLGAVSYILAFAEIQVPLSPSFAKMDLSDLPALIGAFAFGPLCGVIVELIKNVMQAFSSSTGGIGEIANFLMGSSFAVTAGLIYQRNKTKANAVIACLIGSIVMAVAAALTNYYILLPLCQLHTG